MKNLLLIIDPQNDFADPKGSLYVNGAEEAIENICKFINTNNPTDILISQDTHQKFSIGFPDFWDDQELKPFDKIKVQDIIDRKINPKHLKRKLTFILQFNGKEKESITIWPYHCLEGSWGWCFPSPLIDALNNWNVRNRKEYEIFKKGYIPELESYSIFTESNVQYLKIRLPEKLEDIYDRIYISGFCKDICVAESLKDLKQRENELYKDKLVFLDNCMATLDPESPNLKIYEELVSEFGAKIENA